MNTKNHTIKGIQTNTLSFLEKSSSQTLVMLHGWGGSTQSFLSLGKKIHLENKINVLIPDLPGFGESGIPDNWDTHKYEKWLEELLTHKESQEFLFYGHSFGCRIIIRFLAEHPKFKNKVILTGAAGIKFPLSIRQKCTTGIKKILGNIKNIFPEKIKNLLLRKIFRANDWANCPDGLKSTFQNVLAEEDLREIAQKIRTQILLIWGKNDSYTPLKAGKIYQEKFPNSELKVLETGKHGIHYTHEEEILKLVKKFI